MANTSQRVSFVGTFDAANILENLKAVKKEMIAGGMSATMFDKITKQIAEASSAISNLEAKLKRGFANESELKEAERQMKEIYADLNGISGKLENLNTKQNVLAGITGTAEKELKKLEKSIEKHKKEIQAALSGFFVKDLKMGEAEAGVLASSVKTEQDITNEVKNRLATRQKELDLVEEQLKKETKLNADAKAKDRGLSTLSFAGRGTKKADLNTTMGFIYEKAQDPNNNRDTMKKLLTASFYNLPENLALSEARKRYQVFNDDGSVKFAAGTTEAMRKFSEMLTSIISNATNMTRARFTQLAEDRANTKAIGEVDKSGNFTPGTKTRTVIDDYNTRSGKLKEELDNQAKAQNKLNNAESDAEAKTARYAASIEKENTAISKSSTSLVEYIRRTREAVMANRNLYNTFDTLQFTIQRLFSTVAIFGKVTQIIKKTFNEVRQLDKAFASIAMVTNYSVNDMWESYGKYAELANELGQSTKDVVASSALFFQQG